MTYITDAILLKIGDVTFGDIHTYKIQAAADPFTPPARFMISRAPPTNQKASGIKGSAAQSRGGNGFKITNSSIVIDIVSAVPIKVTIIKHAVSY